MKLAYPLGVLAVSAGVYAYAVNQSYSSRVEASVEEVVSEMAPDSDNGADWDAKTRSMRFPSIDVVPDPNFALQYPTPENKKRYDEAVRVNNARLAHLRNILPEANREGKRRALNEAAFSVETLAIPAIALIVVFVMWVQSRSKKKPMSKPRSRQPKSELGMDDLTELLARRAATKIASVDTFQTRAGPIIVEWALAPDPVNLVESLLGDFTEATAGRTEADKAPIRAKLREILTANPNVNLAKYADALGIVIISVEGQAASKRSGLAALLAETDDPDDAHVIYEKYLKDRGIPPGSDREAHAKAIFSEYMGRLLDPDSE
jgi:hypothetical protein